MLSKLAVITELKYAILIRKQLVNTEISLNFLAVAYNILHIAITRLTRYRQTTHIVL